MMNDIVDINANERALYKMFWSLQSNNNLVKIYARFGYEVFHRSSVLEWFGPFIAGRAFKGKRCVEIGTRKGLTAIVLAGYFDEVVTIDIKPDEEKHKIAEYVGVKNIRFIDVKDNAEKAKIINGLEFDAAYVDGDHAKDTESDFNLVRRCGRVLFHEYWETQEPVWNLVNRLQAEGEVSAEGKLALWTNTDPVKSHPGLAR